MADRRVTWTRLRDGFPLTPAGAALALLAGLTFWFLGVRRLDLVLLAASVLAAALLLLLLAATCVAALVLRRRSRGAAPAVLETGAWTPTGFRVPLARWLPFLVVQGAWETPVAETIYPGRLELARAPRRALVARVVRRLWVGDVLGLTRLGWRSEAPGPVRILPRPAALEPGATLNGQVAGDELPDPRGGPEGDPVDLRRYGQGDPLRMLLWKVYARTRKAFVRMPERALQPSPRVCAYLPAHADDEPAARLARTLLERDLLGPGWRFGADGGADADSLEPALETLAASGSAGAGLGLAGFLRRAAGDGFGACLLLLPARPGPWLDALAAALVDPPLQVQAVLAVDGWAEPGPAWRRWLLKPGPAGDDPVAALDLLERLAGLPATLVDVRAGGLLANPAEFLRKRAGRAA